MKLEPANAALVPTDGVLVLSGVHGMGTVDPANIEIAVTLAGVAVEGAVEWPGTPELVIWRPAAPLMAGATYAVTGVVVAQPDVQECTTDLALDFEFTVDAGPAAPLAMPEVMATSAVLVSETSHVDTLVCCEDTFPDATLTDCGVDEALTFAAGKCGALEGHGSLTVSFAIAAGLPVASAGMVVYRVLVDDVPVSAWSLSPTPKLFSATAACASVEAMSLATGEVMTVSAGCFDAGPGEQLGPQALDPTTAITMCEGSLHTCEPDASGTVWDREKCSPWPGGPDTGAPTTSDGSGSEGSEGPDGSSEGTGSSGSETVGEEPGDKGCACATRGAGDPWGPLVLVGLGLGLRRRRLR